MAEYKIAKLLSSSIDAENVRVFSYGTGDAPAWFVRQHPETGCSVSDLCGFGKRLFPNLASAVEYAIEVASC